LKELKWHFPSNDGGIVEGINDAALATFEGDYQYYIARESIQNSIDARKGRLPVKVTFERMDLSVEDIPGIGELSDYFERARTKSKSQDRSESLYKPAVDALKKSKISVLKVSDYNTTGLNGSDDYEDGSWFKLARSFGINSMTNDGGGSFGIGKAAPIVASSLRTVYYTTLNETNEYIFQGNTTISAFEDSEGELRRGKGLYGLKAERGVSSVRDMSLVPEAFHREEQGTDFYIMGYKADLEQWDTQLLVAILNNFWATIYFKELEIEIKENGKVKHSISQQNIDGFMEKYAKEKDGAYPYYFALKTDPDQIVRSATLPLLKDVKLYIKKGDVDLPRKVQMMRKTKMVITTKPFSSLREPYAAVFICNNKEGNQLLRKLEPPAHDDWDPSLFKSDGKISGRDVYYEYRDWIKNILKSLVEEVDNEPQDIPGLGKYLPEENENEKEHYLDVQGEPIAKNNVDEAPAERGVDVDPAVVEKEKVVYREVAIKKPVAKGGDEHLHGTGTKKRKSGTGGVDTSKPGQVPRIDVSNIVPRIFPISDNGDSAYQLVLHSNNEEAGAINIVAIGEDGKYAIELESAVDQAGNNLEVKGNSIMNLKINPEETMKVVLKIQNRRRYALGVEEYGTL